MARHLSNLGGEFSRAADHRAAAAHRGAAAPRAPAVRRVGGVAETHRDGLERHAELVGRDLGVDRLVCLAMRMRPAPERHVPRGIDLDIGRFVRGHRHTDRFEVARAEAGDLVVAADADATVDALRVQPRPPATEVCVADHGRRLLEALEVARRARTAFP